jgi:hypothetical protein
MNCVQVSSSAGIGSDEVIMGMIPIMQLKYREDMAKVFMPVVWEMHKDSKWDPE